MEDYSKKIEDFRLGTEELRQHLDGLREQLVVQQLTIAGLQAELKETREILYRHMSAGFHPTAVLRTAVWTLRYWFLFARIALSRPAPSALVVPRKSAH